MQKDYPGLKAERARKAIAQESSQVPQTTHQDSKIGDTEGYVITEVFNPDCPFEVGDHISYEDYQEALEEYPGWVAISPSFAPGDVVSEMEYNTEVSKLGIHASASLRSDMGAEAIHEVLRNIDLEAEKQALTKALEQTTSHQNRLKIAKHLNHVADFAEAEQRPEWMILDVIPVIHQIYDPLFPWKVDASLPVISTTSIAGLSIATTDSVS